MMIVNLTPHALALRNASGGMRQIAPSGTVARVAQTYDRIGAVDGLPIYRARLDPSSVAGLPEPREDVIYVASLLAAQAARTMGRRDVFAPGPAIRDTGGRIIGADGLQEPVVVQAS